MVRQLPSQSYYYEIHQALCIFLCCMKSLASFLFSKLKENNLFWKQLQKDKWITFQVFFSLFLLITHPVTQFFIWMKSLPCKRKVCFHWRSRSKASNLFTLSLETDSFNAFLLRQVLHISTEKCTGFLSFPSCLTGKGRVTFMHKDWRKRGRCTFWHSHKRWEG